MQNIYALIWGGVIAILGGLIGLGGAEFRLPALLSAFKFKTLQAIIINLTVSLVTVTFSFIFRTGLVNLDKILANIHIILCISPGALIGAYIGVNFATKINEHTLTRIVIVFLICLSCILIAHNLISELQSFQLPMLQRIVSGFLAGIIIGVFSSMLGVAGGELIIPTIILLFSTDIKLAGSLSLAISIPTIIMGLTKYYRQGGLSEIKIHKEFIIWTAIGSIIGALFGSYLLKFVPSTFLYILLGIILFTSALRLTTHLKPQNASYD